MNVTATATASASSGSGWTAVGAATPHAAVDADDAAYAESPAINTAPFSTVAPLVLSDFGFAIPAGATIGKIEVLDFVDEFADPLGELSPAEERTVSLTLDGGSNLAAGSSVALATATGKAGHGPLDVTPDSMPSVSEVNNANFGVVVEPTALEQSPLLDNVRHRVYHVTVRVTYTPSGSGSGGGEGDGEVRDYFYDGASGAPFLQPVAAVYQKTQTPGSLPVPYPVTYDHILGYFEDDRNRNRQL